MTHLLHTHNEEMAKLLDETFRLPKILALSGGQGAKLDQLIALVSASHKSLYKKLLQREIDYWNKIFDSSPQRDKRSIHSDITDTHTQHICRIEIDRLAAELSELDKDIV